MTCSWMWLRCWPLHGPHGGNDGTEAVCLFQTLLEIHHSFAAAGRSKVAPCCFTLMMINDAIIDNYVHILQLSVRCTSPKRVKRFYCRDLHPSLFDPPLQFSLLLYVIDYQHIKINNWYVYPDWAYSLGVAITLSSVVMVPLWAAGQMVWTSGNCKEVRVRVHFFFFLEILMFFTHESAAIY